MGYVVKILCLVLQIFVVIPQSHADSNNTVPLLLLPTHEKPQVPAPNVSNTTPSPHQCILPPYPKNGDYRVVGKFFTKPRPVVGDIVDSYFLEVHCNFGFYLTAHFLVVCNSNGKLDPMPQCVPYCKKYNPQLITCGPGYENEEGLCHIPYSFNEDETNPLKATSESVTITKEHIGSVCGRVERPITTSVAGGRRALKSEIPWHVGVYTKMTRPFMQICGGTIIGRQLVISAAHCFWNEITKQKPAGQFAVAAGKVNRPFADHNDEHAQHSDVREIRIPPRYQGAITNFQDDIAILITRTAFQFDYYVTPACLDFDYDFDTAQLAHNRKGKVGGWGLTAEDGNPSPILMVAEMPSIEIKQCVAKTEMDYLETITSDKICAGYSNGTSVCRGDSGGGFVVPELLEFIVRYFLRGIVSTAPKNDHRCNVFAAARFTHILKHEHFIKKAIADTMNIVSIGDPKRITKESIRPTTNRIKLYDDSNITFVETDNNEKEMGKDSDVLKNITLNILNTDVKQSEENITDINKGREIIKYSDVPKNITLNILKTDAKHSEENITDINKAFLNNVTIDETENVNHNVSTNGSQRYFVYYLALLIVELLIFLCY